MSRQWGRRTCRHRVGSAQAREPGSNDNDVQVPVAPFNRTHAAELAAGRAHLGLVVQLSPRVRVRIQRAQLFDREPLPHQRRTLERAFRAARGKVFNSHGLEPSFRFHDCRHYFASLLIASDADVKVVQARLRHKSAKTTLDTYGHLWPDSDDSTRAAVDGVIASQVDRIADYLRTSGDIS